MLSRNCREFHRPPPPNCAYDVYCFGKLLLELVTGKLGISNPEATSTKEWLDHTLTFINQLTAKPLIGFFLVFTYAMVPTSPGFGR
ncbi:putative protein kinase-like domain superfamily [Helianthus debilis subsp. tardiflorus]